MHDRTSHVLSVVVVDRHRMFGDALAASLTTHGLSALGTTPEVALDVVRTHRPHVIVVAANTEDGASLSLLASLRAATSAAVLVLTAYAGPRLLASARASGAAVLTLDSRGDELVDTVARLARGDDADPGASVPAPRSGEYDDVSWRLRFLTDREWQVLECLLAGLTTDEMAESLGVRPSTANTHVQNLLSKLGVHSRLQAVALVAGSGVAV